MFFLFALRAQLNESNWDTYMSPDSDLPVFIMAHVNWCSHCHRALPSWNKFQKSMSSNNDIVVATLNCSEQERICKDRLNVNGFPAFITKDRERTEIVRIRASPAVYNKVVNRLQKVKEGTLIENITTKPCKYPTIVFKISPNDKEAINVAQEVAARSNYNSDVHFAFQFDDRAVERQIYAQIDHDFFVEMNLEWNIANINSFTNENSHSLFGGNWTFASIRSLNRMFVLALPKTRNEAKMFRETAKKTQNKFVWGTTSNNFRESRALRYFRLSKQDLPALVVIDMRETQFAKLPKATSQDDIDAFFEKFDAVNFDEEIKFQSLEIQSDSDLMFDFVNTVAKWLVVVGIFIIALAVFVLAICLWKRRYVPKYD